MKLHPLLRFLLSTSLIIIIIHCNQVEPHQDPRYEACNSRTTSCGNSSLKISYPFWGVGWPQYRGHPGFNLSCDGRNFKINILSQTYNVIDINYNASTLKIVNEELMMHGECPGTEDYHNTTLNLALFNYTSSVRNATLFYGCPDSKSIRNAPISFTCPGKYKNSLSFFVLTEAWEHELESICGVQIYVPVLKSASIDLSENPRIADVLKGGFEVKWVIEQGYCQECYMSGGCCEYNMSVGNSTCYCKSGSYPTVCPHSETPRINLEAKIGIGIGAASGFLLLMITFVVFARGEKNYHTSSTLPSQSTAQLSSASVQEKSSYFGAQLFSYNELKKATNNFDPSEELGKGGFGTVYHGKLQDGREVAIKCLYEKHNQQVAQFMNELEILTCLEHKNLVKLYGCTPRRSPKLLLVFEYVPNGTLADHLHGKQAKTRPLPWQIRLRIAVETAIALVYLHTSDIIHRDVKTKNILLDTNYSVKVADFGLSRLFPLDVSHISTAPQGSPGYLDPEYHQCYQLTNKSDVYSFGVILAELISGKSPVDISRNRQEVNLSNLVVNKIIKRAWNEIVDPNLEFENNSKVREEVISVAELTFKCLQATSSARPSMEEVLDCLRSIQGEMNQQRSENFSKDGSDIIKECDLVTTSSNDSKSCDKTIQKAEPNPNDTRNSSQASVHANIYSEVATSHSLEDII